jgi:hypothetical protein
MPRMREGMRQLTTLVPAEVIEALTRLAAANGRSRADEVVHALTRHLETPPAVRVEAPPLPPAEAVNGTKRGRPRRPAPPAQGGG